VSSPWHIRHWKAVRSSTNRSLE